MHRLVIITLLDFWLQTGYTHAIMIIKRYKLKSVILPQHNCTIKRNHATIA